MPSGHILLSVPAHESWLRHTDIFAGHHRRYDRSKLLGLLKESRFEVQTIWSYGVPLANVTEKVRNVVHANAAVQK